MDIFKNIDPFLLFLVIIPVVTIALGSIGVFLTKRFYVGPLITLILNSLFQLFMAGIISFIVIIPLLIISSVISMIIINEIK